MVLESIRQHDRMNIKRLNLEQPQKRYELPFDPEREVAGEHIQQLKKAIQNTTDLHGFWTGIEMYHIMRPQASLDLLVTHKRIEKTKKLAQQEKLDDTYNTLFFSLLSKVGLARYDVLREIGVTDEEWRKGLKHYIYLFKQQREIDVFTHSMGQGLLLTHPEKASSLWNDLTIYHDLTNRMKGCQSRAGILKKQNAPPSFLNTEWVLFADRAARLRMLYPRLFHHSMVSPDAWNGMKHALHALAGSTDKDINNLLQLMTDMTILAAEDVELTNEGYKITMRKEPQTDIPASMPIERSF